MSAFAASLEATVVRTVFESWSIRIPAAFEETFSVDDGYWHAWDRGRSISLTSLVVTDRGRPVGTRELLRTIPPAAGDPVANPPGLDGWAVETSAAQPARASRAITGILATDGRLLIATITADDPAWAISTWLSIRSEAAHARSRERRRRR